MSRKFVLDVIERVTFTFLEAFFGALIVAPAFDLSTAKAAATAGVAAAIATAKTLLAGVLGKKGSASLLPKGQDPQAGYDLVGVGVFLLLLAITVVVLIRNHVI